MYKIPLVFSLILLSSSTHAGQTPWFEVAPDARLRLIFSDVLAGDDSTMAAVELDMRGDTKTYWRVPGETGIPLTLDNSSSLDIGEMNVIWPFPEREITYGYVDHVYHGNVVLPLKIEVTGSAPHLDLQLILGVCSDICVPVSVDISHDLTFNNRDAGAALTIAQTMGNTPIPWEQSPDVFGPIVFNKPEQQLEVIINETGFDYASMIATIGETHTVFSLPQNNSRSGLITFEKLGGGDDQRLIGQDVTITFMSPDGPYEVTRTLEIIE